jgi:hypothetical protein
MGTGPDIRLSVPSFVSRKNQIAEDQKTENFSFLIQNRTQDSKIRTAGKAEVERMGK